jgi:caffeoyl-CoA O-methyltransferase
LNSRPSGAASKNALIFLKISNLPMPTPTFQDVDHYIQALFEPTDPVLDATEQSIPDAGMPVISVSANQGKFLHLLALLARAKNILELGTLGGYSTIWLARALPADGRLTTLELDPAYAAVAQKNLERAGLADRVSIRVGQALDTLPQLVAESAGPFDLIFIDADKPPYAEYFRYALQLARPGTLIVADNVIRDGQVLDTNSDDEKVRGVQRFNQMLAAELGVVATILQTVGAKDWDGMALAVVK